MLFCADVCFLLLLFSLLLMSALLHLFLVDLISGIFLCFGLGCFLHISVACISSNPLCPDLLSHCMGSVSQFFRINSWYFILSSTAMFPCNVELTVHTQSLSSASTGKLIYTSEMQLSEIKWQSLQRSSVACVSNRTY